MLINVLDVNLQKVAFLSNDVPALPNYYDDEFHEYRDQGAATFKFTVKKVINNKLQLYARFLNGQSYFSFQIDGNDYLMTPASEQAIHETSEEISFFCVSLDRELMSEQANPLVNTSSHNIQWYFDQMGLISNTQITIGINEVSNLTRTINYDGQETKLARLVSVIGNFDAEFEFITKLNNDGSLGSVTLNIYKENDGLNIQGVGKKRDDVRLIFGENIQAVERDVSTEGFLNATTVTGADDLNWNSASFSYINADGVEEFYKRAGSDTAFAPLSAKIYPAQLSKEKDDIWTRIDFTTEYKNVNDMWAYAVRQFKQYAYHQVTYTVTPSSKLVNAEIGDGPPLAKGDTVIIQDNNYIDIDGNVGLLLSARVSEKIVSETHPENNKLIFSNYKKLKSEVSTDIQAIVNQLVDAATPYIGSIDTTNGTQFKNGTGSTTLSAHIFKGSATTETNADSYEWSKDGTVVAPTQTITVDASGVADKAVYSFKATVGGKVVASQSVTITNVNDGTDGKTSYTHVAWANNITGTDGFTTVYPNLNLIEGTKDFSGTWSNSENWTDDGTYKGLTVKKRTGQWGGIYKSLTIQTSNSYTFSAFVKGSGTGTTILRFVYVNGVENTNFRRTWTSAFDWVRDSITFLAKDIKVGDEIIVRYEISVLGTNPAVWTAGHKWEQGSAATPYIPSASEVITADWPSFIGQYSDFTATASTDPAKYAPWTVFKGIDGNNGRGVVSIEQKYQLTQTSAKPVDAWDNSVWQTTQPTTTSTNKYLWSITRTTFNLAPLTQDIVEQKAVYGDKGEPGDDGTPGTPGTSAINIDLSNKSYNFLANLEVSDSGSVMQAVAGSTTTTFTALQGTAAINITALTCTTTLPTGMTVSIGTLNALSVVVTISVDNTMITPNGGLNFSITAGGVTTTKSFSYSLAINDLTVINLAAINSNLGNVKNIYSNYNGSDGGTYSGTIEINDENIKITATNDNDSNEVSKTQMNGENGIWHSTKLQKTNSPGVYVLSNWSLTGTTLSFESQQSDLTYPNGYSYASYGIDMHARNIVGDSISQTTDVPWTDITRASGVGTSGTLRARINNGVFYAQSKDVTIPSIAPNSTITIGTMSSKFSIVSGFDTLGLLYSPGQLSVASVTVGKDGKIDIGNPNPTTMSGKVIQFSINIPLG